MHKARWREKSKLETIIEEMLLVCPPFFFFFLFFCLLLCCCCRCCSADVSCDLASLSFWSTESDRRGINYRLL